MDHLNFKSCDPMGGATVRRRRWLGLGAAALMLTVGSSTVASTQAASFDGIQFDLPAGWKTMPFSGGLTVSPPDVSAPRFYSVGIISAVASTAAPEAELDDWWTSLGGSAAGSDRFSGQTGAGARSHGRSGLLPVGGRPVHAVALLLVWPTQRRRVLVVADSVETDERYRPAGAALIDRLRPSAALPGPAAVDPMPATSPPEANAIPANLDYELLLTIQALPGQSPGTYLYCLFADGSWRETAPRTGLAGFDLAAAQRQQRFGRWSRSAGTLRLESAFGRIETLVEQPDGTYLRRDAHAREGTYQRISPADGLRLDGRYMREGHPPDPRLPFIVFAPDGSFADSGLVRTLVPEEIAVPFTDISQVLAPGAGAYAIQSNTLLLAYADGRRKPMLFAVPQAATGARSPPAIYLCGVWLKRV